MSGKNDLFHKCHSGFKITSMAGANSQTTATTNNENDSRMRTLSYKNLTPEMTGKPV